MTKHSPSPVKTLPLIEIDSASAILPTTLNELSLSAFPDLLRRVRRGRVKEIFLVMCRPSEKDFPARLYPVGVVARVEEVNEVSPQILLSGQYAANLIKINLNNNSLTYPMASIGEPLEDNLVHIYTDTGGKLFVHPKFEQGMIQLLFTLKFNLKKLLIECADYIDPKVNNLETAYDRWENLNLSRYDVINDLVWDLVTSAPETNAETKQHFISEPSLLKRITGCIALIKINANLLGRANEIDYNLSGPRNPNMPTFGNPKVRIISNADPGQIPSNISADDIHPGLVKEWERFQKIKGGLIEDVVKTIVEDFKHLKSCDPGQAEWTVYINHLDCLLDIYSAKTTPQRESMDEAEKILNQSHYGLEKVKDRIFEYIATKRRNPKGKALILCLVGPPGVGKTSIGESVAESLGLEFVRLSLGGIKDEAGIRGHRRTYVGAAAGQIIQEIRRKRAKNPVFMLDEVDKIDKDFQGDPSSALLEVLDPKQNHSFRDHYVDCPFDLSDVIFICTANSKSGIQLALRDRMDIIYISGYDEQEKIQISKDFLIPRQMKEVGLENKVNFDWQGTKTLSFIINGYTRESGVRDAERNIHNLLSKWARHNLKEGKELDKPLEFQFTEEVVESLLGTRLYTSDRLKPTKVGEAIGMAWTPYGGDTLYIQTKILKFVGKELSVTGLIGKSMEESCKVALSLLRERLEKEGQTDLLVGKSIHIHVPEGAIEKDGPSAGNAIYNALTSAVYKIPLRPYITMTGEITLSGLVTKVGGIKGKVLAAIRDGAKEIILPLSNKRDYEDDLSEKNKGDCLFHFVETVDEALDISLPGLNKKTVTEPNSPTI